MSTSNSATRPKSVDGFLDNIPTKTRHGSKRSVDVFVTNNSNEIPMRETNYNQTSAKRPKSYNGGVSGSSVPVILENMEYTGPREDAAKFERNNSGTSRSQNPYRKTSRSERPVSGGITNNGYAGSTPSLYGGSVNSLPIVHEQYCSCTRWSKLEKTLITVVGVLGFICAVLIITVGLLADDRPRPKHWWVF